MKCQEEFYDFGERNCGSLLNYILNAIRIFTKLCVKQDKTAAKRYGLILC